MTIYRLVLVAVLAYVVGLGAGHLGSVALHHFESLTTCGRETALESAATLAAAPGSIAAAWQTGYDSRWGEAWEFRASARHWNAAFYAAVALVIGAPFAMRRCHQHVAPSPQNTSAPTYD
jgi:hypothetical protein